MGVPKPETRRSSAPAATAPQQDRQSKPSNDCQRCRLWHGGYRKCELRHPVVGSIGTNIKAADPIDTEHCFAAQAKACQGNEGGTGIVGKAAGAGLNAIDIRI